jgi:hypothetical protein
MAYWVWISQLFYCHVRCYIRCNVCYCHNQINWKTDSYKTFITNQELIVMQFSLFSIVIYAIILAILRRERSTAIQDIFADRKF